MTTKSGQAMAWPAPMPLKQCDFLGLELEPFLKVESYSSP